MTREEFDDALQANRDAIEVAQGRGDGKRANKLYAEQQLLIASRDGNKSIVGRGGRSI